MKGARPARKAQVGQGEKGAVRLGSYFRGSTVGKKLWGTAGRPKTGPGNGVIEESAGRDSQVSATQVEKAA